MGYTMNEYNEIYNSPETFAEAAKDLAYCGSVCLHWIDQRGTLLQVLLSYPRWAGGARDSFPLFVAIWGMGAYTFSSDVHPTYLSEKLKVRGEPTVQALCDLINGVMVHTRAGV